MIFYLLNKGQQTVKLLNNDETIESNLDEAINTASELKFSLPLQKRLDSNIYYILIPEYHGNDFLMFKVISEDVQKDRVEYSAVESAYDELKSYEYIKDIRPHQMNAAQMLQQVLKNTRWNLGYVEDTDIQSTTFYYVTILEAIQKIVDLFKVELTFTIQLDPVTQKITGRRVNLYQQQGRRTGKRFEYGSNLLTVTREEDSQNLVTALVGRGKGVQVSGQDTEDTSDDGYGRRLTFADVEWKTSAGAPVNKPKGQEYVEDPQATALYGFSDGHPRIGLVTFEDIEDPNQLINATWSALLEAKRPKVSFKAEVTDVGNLQLGDTIAIIRHDLGIEYFTRVYKVHHNLKDENRNTVEMGDDFSSRSITSAISNAIQISQDATTIANTAAIAANGKNRNFYSNTKPLFANEGDNLFLDLGNGETEMWVWHHGQWEFVQSTVELHTVQKEVKEAQDGLKDAKKEIADNLAKADGDIAELNASIAGQNSKIDGLNTSINTVVIPKVTDITNQVSDVVTKVNEQKNIVTVLQTQATQQGKDISKITTDVHGVTVDLANLSGDVNQTKATVQDLQITLGNAQGDIAQIKIDAKRLSTSLSGKVDNSTYANFVSATNNALNTKLVASDLNGYAKTTDVQATANGLQMVVAKVDNIRIGGTNLIRDSAMRADSHTAWQESGTVTWHVNSVEVRKGDLIQNIPARPNTTYTFSFDLYYQDFRNAWANQFFFVEYTDTNFNKTTPKYVDHRWAGDQFPNTAGRKDKKLTFTTQGDCNGLKMYIRQEANQNPFHIFKLKLEEGNQATDWSPAPEDKANQADYSALNQTVKGLQSTVSSNYGNLQSQISQTAGTIRNEITNKISGVQSQITQNVNNLNLRLNNVSRNLVLNSGNFQDLHGWYTGTNGALTLGKHGFWKNGSENVLWINNPSKTDEVTVSSARFDVVPHTTYTISFYAFASVNVTSSDLYFLGRKKSSNNDFDYVINPIALRRYSPSKAEYITATINTGDSEEGYIRFDNNGSTDGNGNLLGITDIQMEEGSVATPWKPAASDQVLAQINVAAGATLIQNDKIYMDASSTVFSGKAFIPDAAITNISADKINTGTLDAGRINVINLNANNITTGTINGANLKINLNDGEILFQKGRIASTNGNLNIDIDSGTMSVTNWMNEGVYFKDGKLILDDRGFGGLIADNPKYGVIQRSNQMFNNNAFGMELNSPNGVSLRTSNYDGVINTGSGLDGTKNGAVISVDKDGSAVVNGAGTTFLTGGPKFSQSKYSIGTRPHIWIGTFNARLGDRIEIDANYIHLPTTYYRTTGSAPNLCIASDGALVRSTSASKYKTDIKRSYSTEYGEKLLNLPTAIWTDRGQKERYEAGKRHIKPEKYFGMIAEDLADAGLDLLVSRNPLTHEIEGIQYERIAPALLPVIKELKDKVDKLEKKANE